MAHVLIGEPVPTSPEHALGRSPSICALTRPPGMNYLGAERGKSARRPCFPAASAGHGDENVRGLLKLSDAIDRLNEKFGVIANWMVLLACVISAGNAASRYLFSESSNGWLEVQWYLFAGMVLLGGPYTLKMNEHVRVDLVYGLVSERTRIWIDIVCGVLFLLPICVILIYFTWPWFVESWRLGEESSNAGGLIRWPVKLVLPVGFALMVLQGISELIKRVAALEHVIEADFKYEKPLQ